MSFIIGKACMGVKDGACIDACPIDECIIDAGPSMYINPDLCIDCGACLSECPVNAIYESEEDAIQAGEEAAVERNYKYFNLKY